MKSGMLAAESAFAAVTAVQEKVEAGEEGVIGEEGEYVGPSLSMEPYEEAVKKSWVWDELKGIRNIRPSFNTPLGIWGGIIWSGLDTLILRGKVPWTFRTKTGDAQHTKKASLVALCLSLCLQLTAGPTATSSPLTTHHLKRRFPQICSLPWH